VKKEGKKREESQGEVEHELDNIEADNKFFVVVFDANYS